MAVALVTGVSRARGIAAAVAARVRRDGFVVVTSGWAAERLAGTVSARVLAHAHDSGGGVLDVTPESIDRPDDAAALVSILLSRAAAFINGQLIASDGGHGLAGGSWPR